jgi:hypothetical protein
LPKGKDIEYLFEVAEDRIIAYLDTRSWEDYLNGPPGKFRFMYSLSPTNFDSTTYLVQAPLREEELIERRTYHRYGGPGDFRLIDTHVFPRQPLTH